MDDEIDRLQREVEEEEAVLLDTARRLRKVNGEFVEVTRSYVAENEDNRGMVESILEFAGSNKYPATSKTAAGMDFDTNPNTTSSHRIMADRL